VSADARIDLPPARLPVTAVFTDSLVIARRNLLFIIRTPQLLAFSTIQPVMFVLLFRYVFGGAISVPTANYASYLLPGVFVQTVIFGSTTAAVGLTSDIKAGIIDRFRSLPMARSAVLAGRTAADAVRNVFVISLMVAVGYAVGFRFEGGLLSALGAMGIALLFGYAFSWFFSLVGLLVRDPETAQVAGFIPLFPFVFASSIFVSPATMPSWLRGFAEHQPVTKVANAVRGLSLGTATTHDVVVALLWIGGMLLVFAPLATWRYRKG
jgi:ABC transporter DrrB family efflux protein